jgi:hypothetical protein
MPDAEDKLPRLEPDPAAAAGGSCGDRGGRFRRLPTPVLDTLELVGRGGCCGLPDGVACCGCCGCCCRNDDAVTTGSLESVVNAVAASAPWTRGEPSWVPWPGRACNAAC